MCRPQSQKELAVPVILHFSLTVGAVPFRRTWLPRERSEGRQGTGQRAPASILRQPCGSHCGAHCPHLTRSSPELLLKI